MKTVFITTVLLCLICSKEGFIISEEKTVYQHQTYKSLHNVKEVKVGDTIFCPKIHTDWGKSVLRNSYDSISIIANFLKEHKSFRFELRNYTDYRGNSVYNKKITQKNANLVVETLINEFDIPKEMIKAVGYGESSPLFTEEQFHNANESESEVMFNKTKRYELYVLDKISLE